MPDKKLPPIDEVVQNPERQLSELEEERDQIEARERHARELDADGNPHLAKLFRQAS